MSSYEIVIHFSIFNKPYITSFETKVLKYQEEKPLGLVWFISSWPIMHSSDIGPGENTLRGGLTRGTSPVFTRGSMKTTKTPKGYTDSRDQFQTQHRPSTS